MKNSNTNDHVIPRPVEVLPEYAHAKARQALAEKLTEAFNLTPDAATTIANAVVDPSAVRKVAASDCFDPVAVMYSAFCWSACVALRAMMEIRAPFPDQANGL